MCYLNYYFKFYVRFLNKIIEFSSVLIFIIRDMSYLTISNKN